MAPQALVLGGGGTLGVAWEAGLLKGLIDGGVNLTNADLIVGTSAGSIVGSQIALGRAPRDLLAAQLDPPENPPPRRTQPNVEALTKIFQTWATAVTEEQCADVGRLALAIETIDADAWIASLRQSLGSDAWPERRLVITAVDAESGAFVMWDRSSDVALDRAVASSCAVPGLLPPVAIDGRRYMDGGVRSGTSAELAEGFERIVVVAPLATPTQRISSLARPVLDREVAALRAAGSTVEVIVPDAEAREAFGPSMMDAARRRPAAETGERQGKASAAALRAVWSQASSTSDE